MEGGLLAVDPVSDTAVLVRGEEGGLGQSEVVIVPLVDWGSLQVRGIVCWLLLFLQVLDSSPELKERLGGLVRKPGTEHGLSERQVEEKRERVTAWLRRNGLPVEVEGSQVVIAGAVVLEPPYTSESALADNEIVLARVAALLENMPGE